MASKSTQSRTSPGSSTSSSGSKTVTFTGTGPNGATIAAGYVLEKLPASDKPISDVETVRGTVLLQGSAVKSVITDQFESSEALQFKGKAAMKETKREIGDLLRKGSMDGPAANVTVMHDVKMCVVSRKMAVKGIVFGGDDDDDE